MTSSNVTLYGHLTYDTIFDGNKSYETIGSVGNVWKAFINFSNNINVRIEPTEIGEALIYVDKEKVRRASTATLSVKTRTPFIQISDWSHILYLNQLNDLSFVKEVSLTSKKISADICAGKPLKDLQVLKYVDLLFISDEDLWMPIEELRKYVKGDILLHYTSGSTYYGQDTFSTKVEDVLKGVNILGAGDTFAAATITNLISKKPVKEAVAIAHSMTYNLIKKNNE